MAVFVQRDGNLQLIAADNAAGRMEEVEMANLFFRVKRSLNCQGTHMACVGEYRFVRGMAKPQVEFGLPAPCRCLVRNGFQSVSLMSVRVFA